MELAEQYLSHLQRGWKSLRDHPRQSLAASLELLATDAPGLLPLLQQWAACQSLSLEEESDPRVIAINVEHSLRKGLLRRLAQGSQPLPHPPPTCYSAPWYASVELPEVQVRASEIMLAFDALYCGHERYEILEREAGQPSVIGHGVWKWALTRDDDLYRLRVIKPPPVP